MEKFLLGAIGLFLLAASSVSTQKGESFVNAHRSPARKVQSVKSPPPRPISQMPLEGIKQYSAVSSTGRTRPVAAAVAAPTPFRPKPIAPVPISVPLDESAVESPHPAPEPYSFSFAVNDEESGTQLAREESQDASGNIVGFYHILDAEGRRRRVDYTAGPEGFKATINSNEEGLINRNAADADFVVEEVPIERQNAVAAAAQAATRAQNRP